MFFNVKKKKSAFVPGCKSSIVSVMMKMKKKTNKTKTMSNLTLKIVPMF